MITWNNVNGVFTTLEQAKKDAAERAKGIQHYKNYKIQLIITDSLGSVVTRLKAMLDFQKQELYLADDQLKNANLRADTNLTAAVAINDLLKKEKNKKWWYIGAGVVGVVLSYSVGKQVGKLE